MTPYIVEVCVLVMTDYSVPIEDVNDSRCTLSHISKIRIEFIQVQQCIY
jgi:hypothetical protein